MVSKAIIVIRLTVMDERCHFVVGLSFNMERQATHLKESVVIISIWISLWMKGSLSRGSGSLLLGVLALGLLHTLLWQ